MLLSFPQAFDPVASTELARISQLARELDLCGARAAAIVSEDLNTCRQWLQDVRAATGMLPTIPLLADPDGVLAGRLRLASSLERRRSQLDRRPVLAHALAVVFLTFSLASQHLSCVI